MLEPQVVHKENGKKRKIIFIVIIVLLLVAVGGYAFYWFSTLRFYQSTDNAYVMGNQIQVMAQTEGRVSAIYADNTNFVRQGDLLLTLESIDAEYRFEQAKRNLAQSVREVRKIILNNKQLSANIELKQLALAKQQDDLTRRERLGAAQVIAIEELQHARKAMLIASAELKVARWQQSVNEALVLDTPLRLQPQVEKAAYQLREAWLALQRTRVYSPATGYISRRSVQVGAEVNQSTPLMIVVPPNQLWVEANFKEVQVVDMRLGQPVKLTSDFYGKQVTYQGRVAGMDMGTGSAFSILPAQNATGNWIKVVQRLPVRIELEAQQVQQYPLRIGLSMNVSVDISDTSGKMLPDKLPPQVVYQTGERRLDEVEVLRLLEEIITANAGDAE